MSTQGIVSTKYPCGKTKIKVIAGCNGYNAEALGKQIKLKNLQSIDAIYNEAKDCQFGCRACLVVLSKSKVRNDGDDLVPRYLDTFEAPEFNPRWGRGTADYVIVLEQEGELFRELECRTALHAMIDETLIQEMERRGYIVK